jgi:putative endonuclease
VNRSNTGREGEEQAARFVENEGMRLIARNFRWRGGEIDLIALDGDAIVFFEVKTWKVFSSRDLEYAVDARKIDRIVETAKIFLDRNRQYNGMTVRFDVIFINGDGLRHLASAFTERV